MCNQLTKLFEKYCSSTVPVTPLKSLDYTALALKRLPLHNFKPERFHIK